MINFQLFLALPFLFSAVLGRAVSNRSVTPDVTPEIRPVNTLGNVGAVQATDLNGDTRIYYQSTDNSIQEITVPAPFNVATSSGGIGTLVPAQEVLPGTPIAVTITPPAFSQVHVFFVSPSNILSEYIWGGTAWRGGPSCSDCITVNQFAVQAGCKVLYAMSNGAAITGGSSLRVGFVSAGIPGTLTEVDFVVGRGWQLATLPS